MYLIFFYVNINIGDCMLVRLGYVAISTAIDVTSSSPYTYSEYLNKCNIDKLDDVIKSNLLVIVALSSILVNQSPSANFK